MKYLNNYFWQICISVGNGGAKPKKQNKNVFMVTSSNNIPIIKQVLYQFLFSKEAIMGNTIK